MLSFFKQHGLKALAILTIGLAIALAFSVMRVDSLTTLNQQMEIRNSELKVTLDDIKQQRNEFAEKYNNIASGVESQRLLMEEIREYTATMTRTFGNLSMDVRTNMGRINRSLGELAQQDWGNLTCERAMGRLRSSAMELTKEQ